MVCMLNCCVVKDCALDRSIGLQYPCEDIGGVVKMRCLDPIVLCSGQCPVEVLYK